MDMNLQRQMASNEKLQTFFKKAEGIKPFNYDNVFEKKQ
jgi:hypothetical protein